MVGQQMNIKGRLIATGLVMLGIANVWFWEGTSAAVGIGCVAWGIIAAIETMLDEKFPK